MFLSRRFMAAAGLSMLLLATAGGAGCAQTGQPVSSTDSETFVAVAQVTAIDPAKRVVTIKTDDGRVIDVTAGPEVQNFSQIKVGDNVVTTLRLSLTYTVSPIGTKLPTAMVSSQALRAKPGARPAGTVMKSASLTGTIVAVDTTANTVSVVESGGGPVHVLQVKNPERQAYLPKIKPGELLTIFYTQALALEVAPAAK